METQPTFLTAEQKAELRTLPTDDRRITRFLRNGCSLNISNGVMTSKGCNVIYHFVYWEMPIAWSRQIEKWLNVKAVFSEK